MTNEVEIHAISPSLSIWHLYDSQVKVDLFSTKLVTASGLYLIDPVPLEPAALRSLLGSGNVSGIIVTNANHARAAVEFSNLLKTPIYAHPAVKAELEGGEVTELVNQTKIDADLVALAIDGAAPGEIALHCQCDGGTVVFGDALINMGSQGFNFLPAKYCANPKVMRRSLRQLLEYPFERMLFAHGPPIVSRARLRFAELLSGGT